MAATEFPGMITRFPRAELPLSGVRAWISQAVDHQVVFLDIDPIGAIPPHSHGEQWGIVHAATFLSHFRAVDVFADRDRYAATRPDNHSG